MNTMEPAIQYTTSENWYEKVTNAKCEEYRNLVSADLNAFDFPEYVYNGNIRELILYRDELESTLRSAQSYVVPTLEFDVAGAIREKFHGQMLEYVRQKTAVEDEIEAMTAQYKQDFEDECREVKERADLAVAPIKQKHDRLLSYKDTLRGVTTHYGITPNDTVISEDISRDEFETLLDTALKVCDKSDHSMGKLVSKLLAPLNGDKAVVGMYSAILLISSWLLLPFIGICYVVAMIKNTRDMYRNMDLLRLAESLMYTMNFEKYLPQDGTYVLPIYNDTLLQAEIAEKLKELESYNPELAIQEEIRKFQTDVGLSYVSNTCNELYVEMQQYLAECVADLQARYVDASKLTDEELGKQKRLGDFMNESTVMWTDFIMGYESGGIPVYKNFGLTNINIVGSYTPETVDLIKVLFINILMGIRANGLETHVYDAEYLGQSFSEFITPNTAPYISIESKDLSKSFELMQKKASENILAIKTATVLEYNAKNEELGMVTRTYQLFVYLTGLGDKFTENKPVMEFMKYSANTGVIVWTLYPTKIPGCLNIQLPMQLECGDAIHYDYDLGGRAIETFEYALKNNTIKALDYRGSFLKKYIPEDTWWTYNSTKGVDIRLGLEEGDPSKPTVLHFNDGNVHFLLGGATGSGKSVLVDCLIQSIVHQYGPEEVQLVYIDMKNMEVGKYAKDGYSILPHVIVLAGTTDGEYCLSIFDWLMEEMLRRGGVCKKYGVQKVEDLRRKFDNPELEGYNPEVRIPRLILLVDEFQVMFDSSRIPSKIIDKITGRLTSQAKLARAASIHLGFISQEMTGTLPKNVLDNFSIRGALRCTKDVSTTLIGNPAAGTIKDKVGWVYSNDSTGQDVNANKLWKVPYAPISDLDKGITELQEKAVRENRLCLRAKFYDEKEGRTREDLLAAYEAEPKFKDPHFMVMGERTIYSIRPTPNNFSLTEDDKENIFCTAFERQDAMDIIATFLDNIVLKEDNASMLINCADRDTTYLLGLEKYMPEGWEDFLSSSRATSEIIEDLDELIGMREEQPEKDLKVCYVLLLMWEKQGGVGQDEDYRTVENLSRVIRKLNTLKTHFIFVGREKGVPKSIMNLCNHRICAKCDETTCAVVIDDVTPYKYPAPNGDEACFGVHKYGSDLKKFKIYRHKLERELEAREL